MNEWINDSNWWERKLRTRAELYQVNISISEHVFSAFLRVNWWCDKIWLSSARSVWLLTRRNYRIADQHAVARTSFRSKHARILSFLGFQNLSGQEITNPFPQSHIAQPHSIRPINNNWKEMFVFASKEFVLNGRTTNNNRYHLFSVSKIFIKCKYRCA